MRGQIHTGKSLNRAWNNKQNRELRRITEIGSFSEWVKTKVSHRIARDDSAREERYRMSTGRMERAWAQQESAVLKSDHYLALSRIFFLSVAITTHRWGEWLFPLSKQIGIQIYKIVGFQPPPQRKEVRHCEQSATLNCHRRLSEIADITELHNSETFNGRVVWYIGWPEAITKRYTVIAVWVEYLAEFGADECWA